MHSESLDQPRRGAENGEDATLNSQMHISRLLRTAVEHLLLAASPDQSELPRPAAA